MPNTTSFISVHYNKNIATLSLERPQKAQAYNEQMLFSMQALIQEMTSRVNVVIVQSLGHRAFCAGADLDEMKKTEALAPLRLLSQSVFSALANAPFISIAAVHGPAIAGGCEMALACDFRVIGPDATFSLPETSLGLIPSAGGCNRLPKIIGTSRAKEMILCQRVVDSETALLWGLANKVNQDPRKNAHAWAEEIAQKDPVALELAKQIIDSPSFALERVSESLLYHRK
jgi:enoyl-CoA hydratase/carnithine racemase